MVITTEYVPTGITADYLLLKKRDKCKKTSVCVLKTLTTTKRDTVVPGAANRLEPGDYPGADADDAVGKEQRRTAFDVRGQQASLRTGEPGSGEIAHYGAGKTIAEPIRAATAGLLKKAGRVGERLRGMADDVWSYATGERGTERSRIGLEQAGAEFERAAAPVVERLNAEEQRRQHERVLADQKTLELERSQRQQTYDGPSLG